MWCLSLRILVLDVIKWSGMEWGLRSEPVFLNMFLAVKGDWLHNWPFRFSLEILQTVQTWNIAAWTGRGDQIKIESLTSRHFVLCWLELWQYTCSRWSVPDCHSDGMECHKCRTQVPDLPHQALSTSDKLFLDILWLYRLIIFYLSTRDITSS